MKVQLLREMYRRELALQYFGLDFLEGELEAMPSRERWSGGLARWTDDEPLREAGQVPCRCQSAPAKGQASQVLVADWGKPKTRSNPHVNAMA